MLVRTRWKWAAAFFFNMAMPYFGNFVFLSKNFFKLLLVLIALPLLVSISSVDARNSNAYLDSLFGVLMLSLLLALGHSIFALFTDRNKLKFSILRFSISSVLVLIVTVNTLPY